MPHPSAPIDVHTEITGALATLTLARPERTPPPVPPLWPALRDAVRSLPGTIRIAVIRGASRAGTSSAADPRLEPPPDEYVVDWLGRPDLISVAILDEHTEGDGLALALACDLRVLAAEASLRVADTVPAIGVGAALVELVGYARALELCVTGRRVDPPEARDLGLATIVVPYPELDAAIGDLVAALLSAPRTAVTEAKAMLREATADRARRYALRAAERDARQRGT